MPTLNLTDETIATIANALRVAQATYRNDARRRRAVGGAQAARLADEFEQRAADAGEASAIIAEFLK